MFRATCFLYGSLCSSNKAEDDLFLCFFRYRQWQQLTMTRSRLFSSGFCQNNGFLAVLIRGGSEKVVRLIVSEGFSTQTCKFERGGSEVVVWKWCWLAAIATTKKPLEPIRFNLIGAESLPFYIMETWVIKCKKKKQKQKIIIHVCTPKWT